MLARLQRAGIPGRAALTVARKLAVAGVSRRGWRGCWAVNCHGTAYLNIGHENITNPEQVFLRQCGPAVAITVFHDVIQVSAIPAAGHGGSFAARCSGCAPVCRSDLVATQRIRRPVQVCWAGAVPHGIVAHLGIAYRRCRMQRNFLWPATEPATLSLSARLNAQNSHTLLDVWARLGPDTAGFADLWQSAGTTGRCLRVWMRAAAGELRVQRCRG
jgi:hypothetical protein